MSNGTPPFPLQIEPPPFLNTDEVALLKRTILKGFPEDDQDSFIRLCQRTRLDPFTKQIYATRRYVKTRDEHGQTKKVPTLVPVTSVIGLTAVADRTGLYDGCEISWAAADGKWRTEWLEDQPPAAAKCVVYRKGRTHPDVAIARWGSYVGQTYNYETKRWETGDFWERMPDFMLAKCAKASSLRAAFPDPLNNVFIREELESNITDADTGAEQISEDELKVMRNQLAEEKLREAGVSFVNEPGPRVPPSEALRPAFPEDEIPQKAKEPAKRTPPATAPPLPVAPAKAAPVKKDFMDPEPDDLDMSPAGATAGAPPEPPAADTAGVPAAPPEPPWKEYVIRGIGKEVRKGEYYGKRLGDLSAKQLEIIEQRWIPAIRQQWDDASDVQKEEIPYFESAIAFSKMAKPW